MHAGRVPRLHAWSDAWPRQRAASGARCCSPRWAWALLGALIEATLLRRLYRAPELLQLIATFGIVLIVRDAALHAWGPEDLLGPRAPGLRGAVDVFGRAVPQYDLFLIAVGPLVLLALDVLLKRTRCGAAGARGDREPRHDRGARRRSGAAVHGRVLRSARCSPASPARCSCRASRRISTWISSIIADAFVVTVVGGLGSIPGAFIAALVIGLVKALCIGVGDVTVLGVDVAFSKLTLVAEFVVMALVLVVRP